MSKVALVIFFAVYGVSYFTDLKGHEGVILAGVALVVAVSLLLE